MVITLLTENDEQTPPNQAQLVEWATQYEQTFPVLSDHLPYIHRFGGPKGGVKLPTHILIGRQGEILRIVLDGAVESAEILAALDDSQPQP